MYDPPKGIGRALMQVMQRDATNIPPRYAPAPYQDKIRALPPLSDKGIAPMVRKALRPSTTFSESPAVSLGKALMSITGLNDPLSAVEGPARAMSMLGKVGKALPMDEASRMARAKEQGFDVDAFHGSGRSFESFDPGAEPTTAGGLRKYGTFVSEDPKVASRYAQDFNPESGAQVYPLKVRAQSPLDLSASDFYGLQRYVDKIDNGEGLNEVQDVSLDVLLKGISRQPGQHPIEAIKAAGHDAIRLDAGRHGTAEREFLVFDPANIRSKFAAFDPKNIGKPGLMGGLGAALVAQSLKNRERR